MNTFLQILSPSRKKILFLFLFISILIGTYLIIPVFTLGKYLEKKNLVLNVKPTRILDKNGKLISELFFERYGSIKANAIPKNMKNALLSVEDTRFYSHFGIDFISLFRAIFKNIFSGSYKQGASTITQQLARTILNERQRTLRRKVKEAALAFILESTLSKNEILAEYMNRAYLGHGAYGFENGAKFYFQKTLQELNQFECILLASLPAGPNRYSPLKHVNRSFKRSRRIIEAHINNQSELFPINPKTIYTQMSHFYGSTNRSPTETVFGEFASKYASITEYVRNFMSREVGAEALYSGGYTIQTTIDLDLQEITENITEKFISERNKKIHPKLIIPDKKKLKTKFYKKLKDAKIRSKIRKFANLTKLMLPFGAPANILPLNQKNKTAQNIGLFSKPKTLQTAIIALEINNSKIIMMKGGSQFSAGNQFNRALFAYRQTGSAIKPIIYSTAIENGILTTASILEDEPLFFDSNKKGEDDWMPENYSYQYKGKVSLRKALALSINTPAIKAADLIGWGKLGKQYRELFFPNPSDYQKRFRPTLSSAIGAIEFTTLEMALAYSAFAQNGYIYKPSLIQSVVDSSGNEVKFTKATLPIKAPPSRRAFKSDVAEVMTSLLVSSGHSTKIYKVGFKKKYAGKTGTTNHYKDAWFVGYTPDLILAIWIGYDNPAFGMVGGGTGSGLASPLWGKIMKAYSKKHKLKNYFSFTKPRAVKKIICKESGLLPKKSCKHRKKEIFLKKYVPKKHCNLNHKNPNVILNDYNEDFD